MSQPQCVARKTVGIVLAGGRATRLGALGAIPGGKAAVPLGGRPFLEAVLAAVAPHVERIVVVAGHAAGREPALNAAESVARLIEACGSPPPGDIELIHDTVPLGGPLSALADALRHVTSSRDGSSADAAVVVSCDVPLVRTAVVRLLLDRLRGGRGEGARAGRRREQAPRWVVPEVFGHPQGLVSALRADLLPAIEAHLAAGRRDVRGLIDALEAADPSAVCRLDAGAFAAVDPDLESFRDVDTPEDLAGIATGLDVDPCAVAILRLLAARSGTICPSEAARAVAPDDWRSVMDDVRAAGAALAARGRIVVTQGGRPVDPATATGPIRYGRPEPR